MNHQATVRSVRGFRKQMGGWHLALTIVLLSALAPSLDAQEVSKTNVRCAFFPGRGTEKLHLFLGEDKSMELEVWGGRLSPEQQIPGLKVWRVGFWKDDPGTSKRVFVERGRVTPKDSARQWLLMLQQTRDADTALDLIALAADAATLKEGGVVVLNLTRNQIGAVIKEKRYEIVAGKSSVIDPGTRREEDYQVSFHFKNGTQWRPFVETVWYHGKRRRHLAIIVQPTGALVPRMYKLEDVSAPEE